MKHARIQSIESILEKMAEAEDRETFETIEQELKTELRSYLTPMTHEIIEYYAKIWRVLREHIPSPAIIQFKDKPTIEELNYGVEE